MSKVDGITDNASAARNITTAWLPSPPSKRVWHPLLPCFSAPHCRQLGPSAIGRPKACLFRRSDRSVGHRLPAASSILDRSVARRNYPSRSRRDLKTTSNTEPTKCREWNHECHIGAVKRPGLPDPARIHPHAEDAGLPPLGDADAAWKTSPNESGRYRRPHAPLHEPKLKTSSNGPGGNGSEVVWGSDGFGQPRYGGRKRSLR